MVVAGFQNPRRLSSWKKAVSSQKTRFNDGIISRIKHVFFSMFLTICEMGKSLLSIFLIAVRIGKTVVMSAKLKAMVGGHARRDRVILCVE